MRCLLTNDHGRRREHQFEKNNLLGHGPFFKGILSECLILINNKILEYIVLGAEVIQIARIIFCALYTNGIALLHKNLENDYF